MSKYITEFNETGTSTINVPLLVKNWTDKTFISRWKDDTNDKYTLVIYGKRRKNPSVKAQITKEQAMELIANLDLIHVKSTVFRSGSTYYAKTYVKSEIERLTAIKEEKEQELTSIRHLLYNFAINLDM